MAHLSRLTTNLSYGADSWGEAYETASKASAKKGGGSNRGC